MLEILVEGREIYDEEENLFHKCETTKLQLEHSLISLSKWESKWKVPFIGDAPKTNEQTLDYIKAMTISRGVPDSVYRCLSAKNYEEIKDYLTDPMTATTIREYNQRTTQPSAITSELLYYYMFSYQIPMDCQKWHLSRLIMLIRVFNAKAQEQEAGAKNTRVNKPEIAAQRRALNAQRRAKLNSSG